MPFLIRSRYLDVPQSLLAWVGWLALLAIVIYLAWKWKAYNSVWGKRERITLILLILSVPVAGLLIGVRLPADRALPPPGLPVDQSGPLILVFAAIPWVLAAGFLGPTPAACLAALSGLLVALWDTHSPFTPVEMALLAVLLAWALGQRYRTPVYRVLSHPLVTTLLLGLLYPAIVLIEVALTSGGILVTRLDYALTHLLGITLAFGVELLIAGLVGEVLRNAYPTIWGGQGLLLPSPAEKSLQARFLYGMAPLAFALIITLMIGDWIIAGNAARSMLRERMANAAQNAADTIPFFMEAGQNLISQLAADPRLYNSKPEQLNSVLSQDLKTVPYFRQLFVLDTSGSYSASYPLNSYTGTQAPVEEQMGIQLALNGVPFQSFTVPPAQGETTAQISFVAAILDRDKVVHGVLIGRSDLTSNPFTQPVLASLNNLAGIDGQGILLDENSRILYHPDRALVMTKYPGRISEQPVFYDGTASDGTRQLVYFQPAAGRPWAVVLTVPAHRAQELALQIAAPMLGIILVLAVLAVLMLSLGLKVITASLQNLSVEAGLIAQGQLDHKLPLDGEDEVGRLRRAFEQMRASLKARLDELNRLLLVSQGVASSLDIKEAVLPVLESALAAGGCAARVVLAPSILPGLDGDTQGSVSFGLGPAKDLFAQLDEQILEMTRTQERVVLTNPSRPRLLNFTANTPPPEALLAVALRHESLYYGTLWVAYDKTHNFSEEEIRFLVTLAGQAALAAANNRLFLTAEIGRQRLAAILASTPDPVLVTDQNDHLLLANPAAWQVLGLGVESDEGHPIDKV
ncbi:MAG TPA: cache domain-containing protein, partial [Anaerolineales bacterium]